MASSGNFCVWNRNYAAGGGTPDFGSITQGVKSTLGDAVFGTFGVDSGKWYWEWKLTGGGLDGGPGWANSEVNSAAELGYNSPASATGAQCIYVYASTGGGGTPKIVGDGPKSGSTGEDSDATGSVSNNVIFGLAADFDNNKWYYSIDGSFDDMRSGQNPATGSNPMCSATGGGGLVTITRTSGFFWTPAVGNWAASSTRESIANFGQDSTFLGTGTAGSGNADANGFGDFKYAVPSGFLAMCSANLPVNTSIDPNLTDTNHPVKLFGLLSYTGNAGANSVTGLGFKPDLVWGLNRSASQSKRVLDSSRGGNNYVYLDSSAAQTAGSQSGDTVEFLDDGIKWNNTNGNNDNTVTYVAACWRANGGTTASNTSGTITTTVQTDPPQSFSIVTYTGTGSNATIGHGLSAAPNCVWIKNLSQGDSWIVYNSGPLLGNSKFISVDLAISSASTGSSYMQNTSPTSTVVSLGTDHKVNASTEDYVAYCWRDTDGFQKFGTFKGNGDDDGNFVYTGFRPRFVIIAPLRFSGTPHWVTHNTAISLGNPSADVIDLDDTYAEYNAASRSIDILSNGFKVRTSDQAVNTTSGLAYFVWGDVPFKYGNAF